MFRHYRKSVGALVVYDITKRDSFLHVKKWLNELKDHAEPDIVVVLVGNKVDIVESDPNERKVTKEEGQKFADDNNLLFFESSAIADINVRRVFTDLLEKIYDVKTATLTKEKYVDKSKRLIYVNNDDKKSKEEGGCCN